MKKIVNKTVNLDLVGKNGNAFVIMGLFGAQAKQEGWTKEEIDAVSSKKRNRKTTIIYSQLL